MIELNGIYASAKVFTDTAEEKVIEQIITFLNQPLVEGAKVRIMPDTHFGAGAPIGFTAQLGDKVVPNLVGVDIGCTDRDTEFLSDKGWVKISEYNGESVAVYDVNENITFFEYPTYIVLPEKRFYHLKTKYGIDQMLSEEHTVLLEKGAQHRKGQVGNKYTIKAKELYDYHQSRILGMRDYFISEIPNLERHSYVEMSDDNIRVQVMVMADGHLEGRHSCVCKFKKERKINRCISILEKADIRFTTGIGSDGVTWFRFNPPVMEKRIGFFADASLLQMGVIADEIKNWDYDTTQDSFCSVYKEDVDFVQYVYACLGYRTSINFDAREGKESYRCIISKGKPRVQLAGFPKTNIKIVKSVDGKKYCFSTSTGFWIMRRNGCIAVTGNCGMTVVNLGKINIDLDKLDSIIHQNIPVGRSIHSEAKVKFTSLELRCKDSLKNTENFAKAIGTLGGGNHFIEVSVDEHGRSYLVIHSGSRNLGKQVADHYQKLAIASCNGSHKVHELEKDFIARMKKNNLTHLIQNGLKEMKSNHSLYESVYPDDLCFVTGSEREDYLYDMHICQEYASLSRFQMAQVIIGEMFNERMMDMDWFESIHNYINFQDNIIRKGAVSAYAGERLIIPMNMRDGCIIAVGKGNEDWNNSAPHGAGRLMGRNEAKRMLSLDQFKSEMEGVFSTTVNASTLDEAPMAYKPMQEILDNIGDTVEVEKIIKPIYNFKAVE